MNNITPPTTKTYAVFLYFWDMSGTSPRTTSGVTRKEASLFLFEGK